MEPVTHGGTVLTSAARESDSTMAGLMNGSDTFSLHLDNLSSQPTYEIDGSGANLRGVECSVDSSNQGAVLESKQREHQRLFKEYLNCCKGTFFDCSMEPQKSYLRVMDNDDFSGGGNPSKELSSFLPPHRSIGNSPASRKTSASAAAHSASGLFVAGGRDAPASARAAPTKTHKRASICNPAATYCDSPPATVESVAIPSTVPKLPAGKERSMYRSQVATALKAGRAVWL
jgi:hypothetical protein